MSAKLLALLPGGYLTVTRYPGILPVAGFIWLELLPFTLYLYFVVGLQALLYPILHIGFLGLYELGYFHNDRAQTATERPERGQCILVGWLLLAALFLRILFFISASAFVVHQVGVINALNYVASSLGVVALLFLHTWLGERRQPLSHLRVVSFGWLASSKYAPAALALVAVETVASPLVVIFLVYGAMRVVDYTVSKFSTLDSKIPEFYSVWYLAALPVAIFMCLYIDNVMGGFAIVGVFGAYYLVSFLRIVWGVVIDLRKRIDRIDA